MLTARTFDLVRLQQADEIRVDLNDGFLRFWVHLQHKLRRLGTLGGGIGVLHRHLVVLSHDTQH